MTAWKQAGKELGLSALFFVVVLAGTGELHRSSNALQFFAALWLVQAAAAIWHAWRHPQGGATINTSATKDIPPVG